MAFHNEHRPFNGKYTKNDKASPHGARLVQKFDSFLLAARPTESAGDMISRRLLQLAILAVGWRRRAGRAHDSAQPARDIVVPLLSHAPRCWQRCR